MTLCILEKNGCMLGKGVYVCIRKIYFWSGKMCVQNSRKTVKIIILNCKKTHST